MLTSPTRMVCPVDFSSPSEMALQYAVAIARWHGAEIIVLHVHPMLVLPLMAAGPYAAPPVSVVLSDTERAQLDAALTHFAAATAPPDLRLRTVLVEDINVPAAIMSHVDMTRADFVVMGTEGRSGFQRLMLGSVAERVLRRATCPVLTVPPHAPKPPAPAGLVRELLCPIDFSASSAAALQWAATWGAKAGARVTALHVVEMPPEAANPPLTDYLTLRDRLVRQAREEMERSMPEAMRRLDRLDTLVTVGRSGPEILRVAEARTADLIVMGVRGRGPIDLAFFGSTTHQVVRRASCPVLAVHPD